MREDIWKRLRPNYPGVKSEVGQDYMRTISYLTKIVCTTEAVPTEEKLLIGDFFIECGNALKKMVGGNSNDKDRESTD